MTITRIDAGVRMSQAVVHDGRVYLSGQVAKDGSADIAGQTQQILDQIDALLAKAGTDKSKLLTVNIWLTDIANFAAMNAVYDRWVHPTEKPARATVESKLASPEYKIEIAAVGAI
jgi:enamine deaminase RidA (YjgF/YER057c/UK114 family)